MGSCNSTPSSKLQISKIWNHCDSEYIFSIVENVKQNYLLEKKKKAALSISNYRLKQGRTVLLEGSTVTEERSFPQRSIKFSNHLFSKL